MSPKFSIAALSITRWMEIDGMNVVCIELLLGRCIWNLWSLWRGGSCSFLSLLPSLDIVNHPYCVLPNVKWTILFFLQVATCSVHTYIMSFGCICFLVNISPTWFQLYISRTWPSTSCCSFFCMKGGYFWFQDFNLFAEGLFMVIKQKKHVMR